MIPRLLVLILVLGCAGSGIPRPAPTASNDTAGVGDGQDAVCDRQAEVTVHVDNRSSMSVQLSFGAFTPARAALGFARTTYSVPRYYLEHDIRLRIVGGGLALGMSPPVSTEPVDCNDATLIIGPRPRYSFFYGDLIPAPAGGVEGEEPPDTTSLDP